MFRSPFSQTVICCFLLLASPAVTHSAEPDSLLDLQTSPESSEVLLTLESFPADFLYITALKTGAGSNDLNLDRGQLDRTRWVRFERYGNRVLLLEPNLKFRAASSNPAERAAVAEAFAQSVLAGFEIHSETDTGVTFDLSPMLIADVTRLESKITGLEQGNFSLDPERSAIDTAAIRQFPDNVLLPVILTYAGEEPGDWVRAVTPTPDSLTVRVLHQFARLPDDAYSSREFHPRSGYFSLSFRDYAAPLETALERRLIYRHDLRQQETLTYYVDNGTPEPMRSALLEGAGWWADAFAAAGYPGLFRVGVLPPDADPLDIRYNVIQWVHRATRGWSYGGNVSDPRNGRILKGHVSLGSLRVRQDQLIAEALTAPFVNGDEQGEAATRMALARLRQLSAHEVGHTLGLDHNFAASFSGDPSVMDYPHPNLYLDAEGEVQLDRAYRSGISEWDKLAIRYGYSKFESQNERDGLKAILDEADQRGLAFIADQDARPAGSAHPDAHLWDNGSNTLARLDELLAIREAGLAGFSKSVVRNGTPLFEMERRLVPLWLLHRYQVDAVAKLLGGLEYDYRLRSESGRKLQPVDGAVQKTALETLGRLLAADQLALPANLHYLIPPPAAEHRRDREFFKGTTGAAFDHLEPSRAATEMVLAQLLQPQRLSRMQDQAGIDPTLPDAGQVLSTVMEATWLVKTPADPYLAAVRQASNWITLDAILKLDGETTLPETVRIPLMLSLNRLRDYLTSRPLRDNAAARVAVRIIDRHFETPRETADQTPASRVPPGSPIGG
jgi:hypothetical protein